MSNAFLTYPEVRDSTGKLVVIPDNPVESYGSAGKAPAPWERGMSYQVVGEVTAHQALDG